MVSNGETALALDVASNNTAYWCDQDLLLLTPGAGDPMPSVALA